MNINGHEINGSEINGQTIDFPKLSALLTELSGILPSLSIDVSFIATFYEVSGITADLTDSDRLTALLAELSGFSATMTWAPNQLTTTLTETSRLSGAMNMPIRIRTGIMRAIQIPFHGEVVS